MELYNANPEQPDESIARDAVLDRYLELKAQISAAQEELDALKAEVFDIVTDNNGKISKAGMEFTVQYRKTWNYPAHIIEHENQLKAAKKTAEQTGEAVVASMAGSVVVRKAR